VSELERLQLDVGFDIPRTLAMASSLRSHLLTAGFDPSAVVLPAPFRHNVRLETFLGYRPIYDGNGSFGLVVPFTPHPLGVDA
jgi:hypothetical protein